MIRFWSVILRAVGWVENCCAHAGWWLEERCFQAEVRAYKRQKRV